MSDLSAIKGLGPKTRELLDQKLGIRSQLELAYYFPRDYEDLTQITPINTLREGEKAVIKATILQIASFKTYRRGMHITEAILQDNTGQVKATWFNQPYLAKNMVKGVETIFIGTPKQTEAGYILAAPQMEKTADVLNQSFLPIYPETQGLTSKMMRGFISAIMTELVRVEDYLPENIRKDHKLLPLSTALREIHFPSSKKLLEDAKRRLALDELIFIQLAVTKLRSKNESLIAPVIEPDIELIKRFLPQLPFELTAKQKAAAWEIIQDLGTSHPMQRMLEGDVGSGKTVVAAIAALQAIDGGHQVGFMAPTEVLAKQHFDKFCGYYAALGFKVGLLTRSFAKICTNEHTEDTTKTELTGMIGRGEVDLLFGTHTLIQEKVSWHALGLAIVDEQHRFGVGQREALTRKGHAPHFLSLTATPIPRSLALTIYGDLKISILNEKPKGRLNILTRIFAPDARSKAIAFATKQIELGHQVFVLTPLIDDSDKVSKKAATSTFAEMQKIFGDKNVGLLHGKMKGHEKTEIMNDFAEGRLQVLVATTVIEVGIDVPNATVIMIENPEGFGLAQLHQLRGRVGRGSDQSYCILLPSEEINDEAKTRLEFFAGQNDGFKLAEYDMKTRGPGSFFTTRQSGFISLRLADLFDTESIKLAQEIAETVATDEPEIFNHPMVARNFIERDLTTHAE
jgi:ATP-dependent DNA helicase RecG